MKTVHRILIALLVMMGTLAVIAPAGAQDGAATPAPVEETELPRLGLRPIDHDGYFRVELEPGESTDLTVEIGNFGAGAVDALTYVADVYTLVNGGFGVELEGEETDGATNWLSYERDQFVIEPQEARQYGFTVEVPRKTQPGEYITAVVVQPAEPIRGTGGLQLDQVVRQAVAVVVEVPGEREPALEIGDASHSPAGSSMNIQVAVENTGNVLLKPIATLDLLQDDELLLTVEVTMDSFYAGTASMIEIGLLDPLEPGEYTVRLAMEADGVSARSDDLPLVVEAPAEEESASEQGTIAITGVTLNELRVEETLQAVEVVVAIDNQGAPLDGGQLTLRVERDGELVEEIVLGASLSFPGGPAEFRQRYLPLTGWTPGSWTFSVTLSQADPDTGSSRPRSLEAEARDPPVSTGGSRINSALAT
jgi:hypothetical protein